MKRLLTILLRISFAAACKPDTPVFPNPEPQPEQKPEPEPEPEPEPGPEPEPEPPKSLEISITGPFIDLYPGESAELGFSLSGGAYDPAKEYKVRFTSSDSSVATVDQSGRVTARKAGSTIIRATEIDSEASAERKVYVVNLSQIKQAYSKSLQLTCGHTLYYKSVVQSWDFFDDCMYACQVCGSPHTLTFTRKPVLAQGPQEYMHLKYFGHGDNIFVERCPDGDWLWVSNYGTLESGQTNRYADSQVLSRVRFTAGRTILPAEANFNFVIPGMKRICASYDPDNGSIGIWCRDSEGKAWFYVYDIEEVKAAPRSSIRLSYDISYGSPVRTERPTVTAANLSNLTPLYKFKMPFNNVPQGYDWHHGKVWFFRGGGAEAEAVAAGTGKNWATAYLVSPEGKKLTTVSVPWVADLDLLASEGITDLGYFEAEGIKVKDGVLYLGFASKDAGSSPNRRVNIFQYPLD